MEDLEAFLSPEQAQEAFDMLDNNGDGKLVLADIRDAVIKIYKERRNLALSLKVPLWAAVSRADTVNSSISARSMRPMLSLLLLLYCCLVGKH